MVTGSGGHVDWVINARIHEMDILKDSSRLTKNLLTRGIIRPYVNEDQSGRCQPGGLDADASFHVLCREGAAHPHLCALGIPTEGVTWFNAADARPDVGSTAISQLALWAAQAVERLQS